MHKRYQCLYGVQLKGRSKNYGFKCLPILVLSLSVASTMKALRETFSLVNTQFLLTLDSKSTSYTDFLSKAWRFPYSILPVVIIYEICLKVFMTSENLLALL